MNPFSKETQRELGLCLKFADVVTQKSLQWGIRDGDGSCDGDPSAPRPMTYTVILVDGAATHPISTIEADSVQAAWAQAKSLFPYADLALVVDEGD